VNSELKEMEKEGKEKEKEGNLQNLPWLTRYGSYDDAY